MNIQKPHQLMAGGGREPTALFTGRNGGQDLTPEKALAGLFADTLRERKITAMQLAQRPTALAYIACYHPQEEVRMRAARIIEQVNAIAITSKSTLDLAVAYRCFFKLAERMGDADPTERFYVATRAPEEEDRRLAHSMLIVHASPSVEKPILIFEIYTMGEHIHARKDDTMETQCRRITDKRELDALVKREVNPFRPEEVKARKGTFVEQEFWEIISNGW